MFLPECQENCRSRKMNLLFTWTLRIFSWFPSSIRRSSQVVSQRVDWNSSSEFNFNSSIYSPLKILRQTERESINFPQLKGKRKARKCAKTRGGRRLDHSNSLFSQCRRKFSHTLRIGRKHFSHLHQRAILFPTCNFRICDDETGIKITFLFHAKNNGGKKNFLSTFPNIFR